MDNISVKGQLLTDFFTHYPMGGALYDAQGALLEVNEAMCERFWITKREDFLLSDLFKTDLLSDLQKEHLLHGSVVSGTIPIGFTIIPSTNNKGIRVGYTLLLTDPLQKEVDATRYDSEMRELEYITQKVTEAIPDTILLVNRDLVVDRVIAYATDTCITPEAINRRIDDLPGFIYPDETKRQMADVVKKCMDSSKPVSLNLSIPGHETSVVYFKIRMLPIRSKYVIVYIRNVSDVMEKEKENKALSGQLAESQSMMELALSNSKVSTYSFCFDRFNTCDHVHCQHCFQFHGVTDTLLDKNKHICRLLTVLRHTDDKNDFFYLFDEIRKHKLLEFSTDFRLKNNNGEYRHYDVVGRTHEYDAAGRPNLILGCIIDNQKRVEYEESLIKAREKAEKADQLKSAFLANMTHEIRTPLNAIVGFSDLLSIEEDLELRESYVNLIKTNNELLVQLINDVLDVSKIESDMMSFTFADVYLPSIMRDVYGMMKIRMPEGVHLSMDPCPEITLQTDKNRFVQILTNLLTNAIKHTSEGSIQFGCEVNSLNACFYVSDTGNGIPQDQLENIFARFVQLKGHKQGIGLGLTICKGLVAKMGGNISATSESGVGSTFRFVLPLRHTEE